MQQDDYYPFGLEISRGTIPNPKNEYLYNKKELQEDFTEYDYGARFYDPVIGRFTTIDPHARNYVSISSYSYVNNNPIGSVDPDGRDLIVLSAPDHVLGAGHAAVLIGNEKDGYRYYSKNGTHEGLRSYGASDDNPQTGQHVYHSLKEFEESDDNRDPKGSYKVAYEIKTDEATDKKMEAAALAAVKSTYKVLDQSCIDVASDALKAAGLNPGTFQFHDPQTGLPRTGINPIPNIRFKDIMKDNPGGIFSPLLVLPTISPPLLVFFTNKTRVPGI